MINTIDISGKWELFISKNNRTSLPDNYNDSIILPEYRATAFADISEHDAKCKGIYALNPVEMEQSEKCSLHQIGKSKWQSLSGTAHGHTAEYKLLTDWRQYYRIKYCYKGGICDA